MKRYSRDISIFDWLAGGGGDGDDDTD